MNTLHGYLLRILSEEKNEDLKNTLLKNRPYTRDDSFFTPTLGDLHDPYLLPDMDKAVTRILEAREKSERIVIFGDYDVDGVSSTAILTRFLTEIGCIVSYRLPHRVHDGYGLKSYFFDELKEKDVKLVITVDCGTRDIGPIRHAKSLGIDVIVTDHHAVPDTVPEEVIAIINPKRKDSTYPFRDLAGAGVAYKLLHAILIAIYSSNSSHEKESENGIGKIQETLTRYIDFAALGTVSDCMPIIGENRVITALGLAQMQKSSSSGLRKFLANREKITENDADLIGFQIGPRINAAGRMDTPITALRWLLASDEKSDSFFEELDHLNESRKGITDVHFQKALANIDTSLPILFYADADFEHGIIGLVAGKLTEMYGKPSIILKTGHDHPLTRRKGDEIEVVEGLVEANTNQETTSIASCRSPEWCNMIELLDSASDLFIRYGGHRQAAGFTIAASKVELLKSRLLEKFATLHDVKNIPKRILEVECILDPHTDLTLENIDIIDSFRPFGIGNRKPLFLLQDEVVEEVRLLGKEGKHLEIRLSSNPTIKLVAWGWGGNGDVKNPEINRGDIISLIIEIDRNLWNGKESVTGIVRDMTIE